MKKFKKVVSLALLTTMLFSSSVYASTWQRINGNWNYISDNGNKLVGWQRDGSTWYYMDNNGNMKTSWLSNNNKWYYLNPSGDMAIGWKSVNNNWYYLSLDGSMKTGWLLDNNKWYYLNSDGSMRTNQLSYGGKTYYFNSSGSWIDGSEDTSALNIKVLGNVPNKFLSNKDYAYSVVKELSDDKYKGRLSGTDEYASAAMYVANTFKDLGLTPQGDNNTFLQKYSVSLAKFNTIPTLTINNTDLTMFKDFKLHGDTASGTINANQTIFVGHGYEEDYNNIDVKGKNVLFLGDIKDNKQFGIWDRVNLAKSKGATSTLIIPSKYMPISTSEKPIKYEHAEIPCIYITKEVANNLLSINVDTTNIGTQSNANIKASIDIQRQAQSTSYNTLGMIKGKDTSKTIVVSASLDGYGSLPDGRVFNGASADASGIGVMVSLAKYYSDHSPNYNILFAAFGSQTTLMEGSKYFVSDYSDINKVIADIDIYDVGNPKDYTKIFESVGQQYTDLHNDIKALNDNYIIDTGDDVNYPFGNNYQFSLKNIPNVFVRFGDNMSDSLNDKIDNINIDALDKVINNVSTIINTYPVPKDSTISFDQTKVGKEYVSSINETLSTYETKNIKFYYEDNFSNAIKEAINSGLPDKIITETEWWNYNPIMPSEKLRVYCVDQWDEGWEVTNRLDKKGLGEHSGGYQSFTDYSLSVIRLGTVNNSNDMLGTVAHEFNHVTADHNKIARNSDSDIDNQEISGHVYAFTIGTDSNTAKRIFKLLNGNLFNNKTAFINENNWDEYTADNNKILTTPIQWQVHYNKLASVEYYIWQKYGDSKCREIQYDFYKITPRPSVKSEVEKVLNIPFSQLLNDCYDWYMQ